MGRKNYKAVGLWFALALLLFSACKKDKPDTGKAGGNITGNKVYVTCEGSLGNGNSALSLIQLNSGDISEDIFKSANNGGTLGDVFQSMELIGDRFFLCVNNSDKIVIIDKNNHQQVGTINVPRPRYILQVNPEKAYVSTIFSDKVYIINPQTLAVTGSVTMPYQNPEGMLLHNGAAYIATWDTAGNKIYKVNTATDKIEQEIPVAGYAPHAVLEDVNGNLWVLSGNVYKGKAAALTCIDPANGNIIKSFLFPPKADPIRPVFNNTKNVLYFIEVNYNGGTEYNGIYRMNINDASLPAVPLIPAQQFQYYWALGIAPQDGKIYVGDPKGFVQKGAVYVYDTDGKQVDKFDVSLGPGHFFFDND